MMITCKECEYKNNPLNSKSCLYCQCELTVSNKKKIEALKDIMALNDIRKDEYTVSEVDGHIIITIDDGMWLNMNQIMEIRNLYKPSDFGIKCDGNVMVLKGFNIK